MSTLRMVDMGHADNAVVVVPYGPYKGAWRVLPGVHYGPASPRGSKEAALIDCSSCLDCDSPSHKTGSPLCPERRWEKE